MTTAFALDRKTQKGSQLSVRVDHVGELVVTINGAPVDCPNPVYCSNPYTDRGIQCEFGGKHQVIPITRSEYDAIISARKAGWDQVEKERRRSLEGFLPGLKQLRDAIEHQEHAGVLFPRTTPPVAALASRFPREWLYLRAEHESTNHHWSDPTGAARAAKRAMELLTAGASLEDAESAFQVRSELNPFID